jgi:hypothetical protein
MRNRLLLLILALLVLRIGTARAQVTDTNTAPDGRTTTHNMDCMGNMWLWTQWTIFTDAGRGGRRVIRFVQDCVSTEGHPSTANRDNWPTLTLRDGNVKAIWVEGFSHFAQAIPGAVAQFWPFRFEQRADRIDFPVFTGDEPATDEQHEQTSYASIYFFASRPR